MGCHCTGAKLPLEDPDCRCRTLSGGGRALLQTMAPWRWMNVGRFSVVIRRKHKERARIGLPTGLSFLCGVLALSAGMFCVHKSIQIHSQYTVSWRTPLRIRFQSPLVIGHRTQAIDATEIQRNQHASLTVYQQYACQKFGSACQVALAIQRSENPQAKCEIYHYNRDGTLDWGIFKSTPCI
jgi:hypothetical protein